MTDFSTVLLVQILRATIRCVEESPELNHNDPSIRHFEGMLLDEIAKLMGRRGSPGMP
jgi:hypothetical protein